MPMRCYGDKPSWFRKVSPSGAVPVANIDGRVISESNVIMQVLRVCMRGVSARMCVSKYFGVCVLQKWWHTIRYSGGVLCAVKKCD